MKEIKTIKGLINYLEKNESEFVADMKDNEDMTIYEGLENTSYDLINNFVDNYAKVSDVEYKYLSLNIYGSYTGYSRYELKKVLVMDYINSYLSSYTTGTFTEFKKELVNNDKKGAYFI